MSIKKIILENIILKLADHLLGVKFMSKLIELRKTFSLDEDSLIKLQKNKLNKLLTFAIKSVPYYSNLEYLLSNSEIDIKKFPILEKSILSIQRDNLLSEDISKLIVCASSGSTGQQTFIYMSKNDLAYARATQILWWEWAGYKLGDPILQTGINPNRGFIKSIKDKVLNTYYLQAFTHSKKDVLIALSWAMKQNKPVLAGYASSLYVIAKYALEEGIKVDFKVAITWGDKLFDHYKKTITDAFGIDVYETYGSGEGLMLGGQKDLKQMYLMSPNVYVEIVNDKGIEVEDGEMGHVIVTNLNAFSMPLIRYRIGDLAIKLPANSIPKTRELGLPVWQKIIGRDTDLVKTRLNKFLVVHSFTGIFEHIPEIKQFCVIQNDLNGIVIEYIEGEGFYKDILNKIKKDITSYLDEPFEIVFKEVKNILPTKSGKPQLIISKLPKE